MPDVGPVVSALLEKPEAFGRWWNLAGAGVTTQRKIVDTLSALAKHKFKIRVAGKNMLRVVGLFNPMMRELVEMNYLLTNPVLLDDSALQSLLGGIEKTPYEKGIETTLKQYEGGS